MKKFILAITTYNRKNYLKSCVESWLKTRSQDYNWSIIIADDGSKDDTLLYLKNLNIENTSIKIIENNRIGVHQQMNTILEKLETTLFDFCFKIDDDICFLKPGWDKLYFTTAINSNCNHLVFCDTSWDREQQLKNPVIKKYLIGRTSVSNVQGCFFTLTPQILKKVGYVDVSSFGYRGMGHVDYTFRCAKAGFTSDKTPWDIKESNTYITASKKEYKGVFSTTEITAYDSYNRKVKEKAINRNNRIYISKQKVDSQLFVKFKDDLIEATIAKLDRFEKERKQEIDWYKTEIEKITNWYESRFDHLPNWLIKVGNLFK